jgi:hypothetical protein
VVPVRSVDFRPVGSPDSRANGRVPVVSRLQEAFFKTVRGEGMRSAEWLDYIEERITV